MSDEPVKTAAEMLPKLVKQFTSAKKTENVAKAKRVLIESQIAELIETPENGSKTIGVDESIKVTCKRGLTYKADVPAIRKLDMELLPLKAVPAVPATYVFDDKVYEQIVSGLPEMAKKLAEFVTVTPKKASISVKIG